MKKFFFFFLISISVEAQTSVYHPFPDSNAVWVVGVSCNVFPCSCGFFTRYTMGGDTLINGNIYHKIIQDGIPICNPCGCFYIGYYQFIREDTLKRIWAFDSAFMTDTL
ncbi:MAG: hypothetical protein JJE25_06900, partial [Bacteroidia bacterium]|nr:hypothetical protein [Bacteroidia bacterium]